MHENAVLQELIADKAAYSRVCFYSFDEVRSDVEQNVGVQIFNTV